MNDETIIFSGNRKQAILISLVSALLMGLIFLLGTGDTWSIVGIVFFGIGFLACLYTAIPGTVQLKVNHSGIEMKTLFKPMKLSWSDVDEFYVAYIKTGLSRTKTIGIRYSESYKRLKTGRKISETLTGVEGALPDHFNRPAEEICEVLNRYKREYMEMSNQL